MGGAHRFFRKDGNLAWTVCTLGLRPGLAEGKKGGLSPCHDLTGEGLCDTGLSLPLSLEEAPVETRQPQTCAVAHVGGDSRQASTQTLLGKLLINYILISQK